jgi:hypothetical protein
MADAKAEGAADRVARLWSSVSPISTSYARAVEENKMHEQQLKQSENETPIPKPKRWWLQFSAPRVVDAKSQSSKQQDNQTDAADAGADENDGAVDFADSFM